VNARTWFVLPALVFLAFACKSELAVEMVNIPPRDGYDRRLAESREQRDDYFANSPGSPLLQEERGTFKGLEYYETDESLYFVGDVKIYVEPEEMEMVTTSGLVRLAERAGFVAFKIDDTSYSLQVYRFTEGDGGLFLPFADLTTGTETYGAGRYLEPEALADGKILVDFNVAYNPFCAYSENYSCPLPPFENHLTTVAIRAGEKAYMK